MTPVAITAHHQLQPPYDDTTMALINSSTMT